MLDERLHLASRAKTGIIRFKAKAQVEALGSGQRSEAAELATLSRTIGPYVRHFTEQMRGALDR
ncbi:MAG TPA: hypothetical protein EYQ31_06020 [Candidatus Handelsmanbacteria bacterium]|nr:hypothetical protein [Candidatus Handelsmanbacteria bacterium]